MTGTSYLSEITGNRRIMLATFVAAGAAPAINLFIGSLFIPSLAHEFGWTKSQFAVVGALSLVGLFSFPFWGQMADRYGSKNISLIGVLVFPALLFAYSFMTGDIWQYYAISASITLFGTAASTPIFARIIVIRTAKARGLALAILMAGPPVIGGLTAPILNEIITAHGWQAAYRILALCILAVALCAWRFLPTDTPQMTAHRPTSIKDYAPALRSKPFWIVIIGMALCNFGNVLASQQLTPLLLYNNLSPALAGGMVSLLATSVIIGRLLSGVALDRFPTAIVSFVSMSLPAIGFLLLWGGPDTFIVLAISVALIGVSQGAEGDIGGYAAARYLGPNLFGLTYGFITAMIPAASAIGAIVLSAKLASSDSFGSFVLLTAILTIIGAMIFLALSRFEPAEESSGMAAQAH